MGQVIDYPDAPQGEVLRYEFAFYGENYETGNVQEVLGPASLSSHDLLHSDRLLFCLTYFARMIHNLGKHEGATQLIKLVQDRAGAVKSITDNCDNAFIDNLYVYDASTAMMRPLLLIEIGKTNNPRKRWSGTLTRKKGGALVCQPKVSLFGDVAAMSISSTLVLFNRTFRLATPPWRDMFLVGLGAMLYYYERYDHNKAEFLSVAPSAAWDAINAALESGSDETVEPM